MLTSSPDLSQGDGPPTPIADLATPAPGDMPDLAMPNGPVQITGEFHAGAVEGSANGIALRGRFSWNAAIAGSANGVAVSGTFQ